MFLSNPAQYLLSFFNVIEILAECSATRSSLKQLKTITVAQSPRKPRRREKKYGNEEPGDIDDIDGLSADEKSSNDPLPHSFVFILKLWTLYAFIALYSRHVEPLFKYIPGYYVWNTGLISLSLLKADAHINDMNYTACICSDEALLQHNHFF